MSDPSEAVEVNGIPVPPRWSSTRPIQPHSEQMGSSTVVMCMFEDGEHGMEELHVRFNPPVRRSDLRTVDLGRLADYEFTRQLESSIRSRHASEQGGWFYYDGDQAFEVLADFRSQARAAARGEKHYRITDEFLSDVVAWHTKGKAQKTGGGVAQVIKEVGTAPSERTVRRWLAEASKRGLR